MCKKNRCKQRSLSRKMIHLQMIIFLRSLLFNILFYTWAAVAFALAIPLLFLPRKYIKLVIPFQFYVIFALLRFIVGITYEVRGQQHLRDGPLLVASKHQSAWDTMIYLVIIPDIAFVLKEELTKIPIYGQFIRGLGMININRKNGRQALKQLVGSTKKTFAQGRKVLMFPEGTRSEPGAQTKYQRGIAILYKQLQTPVVPVALNSGLYWGRRKFLRYPGTIVVEYLPPIEPGLSQNEFMERLTDSIETSSNRLIEEARGA